LSSAARFAACPHDMQPKYSSPRDDDHFDVPSGCKRPIRVANGLQVRCQSRNKKRCPSCAALHAGDWKQILRSGLDHSEPQKYRYFLLTLTAPSFGKVHYISRSSDKSRRCGCGATQTPNDRDLAGLPISPDTYDYLGAARFNRDLGRLVDATRAALRRDSPTLEYCVVREWQKRLSLHVHLILRLDVTSDRSAQHLLKITAGIASSSDVDGSIISWGKQKTCDEIRADTSARATAYLAKTVNYVAKDILSSRDARMSAHVWKFHEVSRTQLRCLRCKSGPPVGCRAKLHFNLGARTQLISVSRGNAERSGWSFTSLTRRTQRAARKAWVTEFWNQEAKNAVSPHVKS
jgi:hypothetical protein